jgi:hypothetical protein
MDGGGGVEWSEVIIPPSPTPSTGWWERGPKRRRTWQTEVWGIANALVSLCKMWRRHFNIVKTGGMMVDIRFLLVLQVTLHNPFLRYVSRMVQPKYEILPNRPSPYLCNSRDFNGQLFPKIAAFLRIFVTTLCRWLYVEYFWYWFTPDLFCPGTY